MFYQNDSTNNRVSNQILVSIGDETFNQFNDFNVKFEQLKRVKLRPMLMHRKLHLVLKTLNKGTLVDQVKTNSI